MLDFLTTQFGFSVAFLLVLFGIILGCVAYCILLERKLCAWLQDRIGPNRAGPGGLLQPMADGVKFLLKEDFTPAGVDLPIFMLAPCVAFLIASIGYAVIPWAGPIEIGGNRLQAQVASIDIGLLYLLAIGSLSVYGIVMGGWASNNKFSFYGAMRAAAQMLSYEIPMGLAILTVVITCGQLRLEEIVAWQMSIVDGASSDQLVGTWNVVLHPVAFLLLLITVFAETNRMPFDLAETEQELIGGYQTEYSSMKMALFYLGEYAHMITASAFMATLFFGGWELFPFSGRLGIGVIDWFNTSPTWPAMLCRFGVMFGKVACFIVLFMWVRWTLPRLRFDQLMRLAWQGLVPIGIGLITLAAVLVYFGQGVSIWAPLGNVAIVTIALARFARSSREFTGRQPHMPTVVGRITGGAD